MSEKIGRDRHRPPGKWVNASLLESVVGTKYRLDAVSEFANSVRWSSANGRIYGVRPVRDLTNQHDESAVAILGFGWHTSTRAPKVWHIGYLRRETAADIVSDVVERGIPIEGELYEIYVGDHDYFDIKFFVLAPPGNSFSARQRRRQAR